MRNSTVDVQVPKGNATSGVNQFNGITSESREFCGENASAAEGETELSVMKHRFPLLGRAAPEAESSERPCNVMSRGRGYMQRRGLDGSREQTIGYGNWVGRGTG
ncbi:hypothetical protein NDU88_003614 [Pleurodeles waltl]|uniref:Uncharacterized protein n=1 Tax=Pleurodeles waltl TaxID=8319 RepID=A0AAV7QCL1_PLEWA|nr:hypothetical protein NDU88_003614 [Pleurodeles waltl]